VIVLMLLAQLYGVLQLAVLGWAARTVRLRVLALAALAGLYFAGPVAVLLEAGWTRTFAAPGPTAGRACSSRSGSTMSAATCPG